MVIIWFAVWVLISDFGLQNVIGVFDLVFWVLWAVCSVVSVRLRFSWYFGFAGLVW